MGGALPKKWGTEKVWPVKPLFMLSWLFLRPPFQNASVLKTLPPNPKFVEILSSKASKLTKNSVPNLKLGQNYVNVATFCYNIELTKMKFECPPGNEMDLPQAPFL